MRRSPTLALIVLLAAPAALHAQSASLALVGGVNFASFAADGGDDSDSRTGMLLGASALFRLSPTVGFQPEVLYAQKGARVSESFDGTTLRLTTKVDYLEVPLLLRLDVPTAGTVRPFVIAGPSLAYRLSCDIEVRFAGERESSSCDELAVDVGEEVDVETFDVGALVGGGLAIPLGARELEIGVRYTVGLRDLAADSGTRNRALGVVAALRF